MKRYDVQLAESASLDLIDIDEFVSNNDSSNAAESLIESILDSIERLERFPHSGSQLQELIVFGLQGYRQILVSGYRIVYRSTEKMFTFWQLSINVGT